MTSAGRGGIARFGGEEEGARAVEEVMGGGWVLVPRSPLELSFECGEWSNYVYADWRKLPQLGGNENETPSRSGRNAEIFKEMGLRKGAEG